jgi:mono/diheme cytochrome c family protein
MTTNHLKIGIISAFAIFMISLGAFHNSAVKAAVPVPPEDSAVTYKAKCAMCHTPTASKFFDPAKADEELADSILKGKKTDKPPAMPAFAEKGITPELANDLVAHMRQLKATPK